MATKSSVEQSFLTAFENNMADPSNMDKLGIGYKAFMESGNTQVADGLAVYDPTKPYGMLWNDIEDTYFRLGHSIPTVQQQMRRVVTIGNPQFGGSVYKYLDADDSTKFEDGSDATAYVSNAAGTYQVMVEIPKCYTHRYKDGANNYRWMSIKNFEGGSTDKAFRMSGWTDSGDGTDEAHESPYTYISAFEGVLYDGTTSNSCIDGTGNTGANTANDKIISTAGFKPWTDETIVTGRTLITNSGGKQFDWHRYSLMRMCFEIEYLTQDSQTAIPGYTENTSGANFNNDVMKTGLTLSLGNNSGSASGSANHIAGGGDGGFSGVVANSYRGIENFYGHLWQWVDAINMSNYVSFICGIDDTFASDSFVSPYVSSGHTQPNTNGYQSKVTADYLVEAVGSSSTSKVTDYYYQSYENRVLLSGGGLDDSSRAGLSSLSSSSSSSTVYWALVSRC